METNEIKKSSVDEVSFDEKILLATSTINWFAVRTEKVVRQLNQVANANTDNTVFNDMISRHDEVRKSVLLKLESILEEWGNFLDGQDAIDEIDQIVTTPAYDILNDRFKSLEEYID